MQQRSSQQQLERQFDKNQFVQVVSQLLMTLHIKNVRADSIYQQLRNKNQKISGRHILEAIQIARQDYQTRKQIENQLNTFNKKIGELAYKGITCLSTLQYYSIFGKEGLIAEQLDKYVRKQTYVSLKKLKKVIQSIQKKAQKQARVSKVLDPKVSTLAKSNIFDEEDFNSLPDISIDFVLEYVNQNIMDIGVKINLEGMLKRVDRKIYELQQNQLVQKQVQNQLRQNQEQIDNQLFQAYKNLDQKQKQNLTLRSQIKQRDEQIISLNHKYQQQVLTSLKTLEQQNNTLSRYLKDYQVKNQQLQTKLDWFKTNYEGLTKQYQQFLRQKQQVQNKQKKDKQERSFIQRTIKQQLEDAQGKISRLRIQNGELKNKNIDVVFCYENRINQLENKIKQLEQIKAAQYLNVVSNGSSIRNSYFLNRKSNINDGMTIMNSRLNASSYENDNKSRLSSSSVMVFESIIKQNANSHIFKKKKQLIQIESASLIAESDQQINEDNPKQIDSDQQIKIKQKQNQKQKSHLNKSRVQKQKQKQKQSSNKKQKEKQGNNSSNKKQEQQLKVQQSRIKKVLSCYGYFINPEGSRYPSYVQIYEDRFLFLDSKMRQKYSIKFNQLAKIIFCYHNISWLVLKVRSHQRNQKNQIINDIVFDIIDRRGELLHFLRQRCSNKLYESGVKVTFEKQDEIWVELLDSQALLYNFANCYDLNRISINSAGNLFEAKIKQSNALFNFQIKVIMIVSSLGILVFQHDGDYLLQKNQTLLNIIPIVQLMEIQLWKQNRLRLKYKTNPKVVHEIKLTNRTSALKLRQLIQQQIKSNVLNKQSQVQKYSLLSNILNKNSVN